jgi:hypothetical protein
MSFKATDNTQSKDIKDLTADQVLAKIFDDSTTDTSTKPPPSKDSTPANETLPELTNPFALPFNDLEIVDSKDKPKTPGTPKAEVDEVITDPFNPKFNVPGKKDKPADTTAKPDATVNPFDPKFVEVPKGDKKPASQPDGKPATPQAEVNPFDPTLDWDNIPGLTPMDTKPAKPGDPAKPEVPVKPEDAAKPGEPAKPADPAKPEAPAKPGDPVKPADATKPEAPVKPADPTQPDVAKPSDKIEPKPAEIAKPNPVFNENSVVEAVKFAAEKNLPIIAIRTQDGKVSDVAASAMKAAGNDAVFVNINWQNADRMLTAGMETKNFWQLANLAGAQSDVNLLHQQPEFIGRFNAADFKPEDPKFSMKPVATGDVEKVFAGTVKPPTPAAPSKPEIPAPAKPENPGPVKPDVPVPPQPGVRSRGFNPGTPPEVKPSDAKVEPVTPPAVTPSDAKIEPVTPPVVKPSDVKVEPSPPADKVVPPAPEKRIDAPPAAPEKTGPVKLDKSNFTTNDIEKAVQLAKDNNLPLIVYKGADFCGNCPPVKANMERFGREMEGKAQTDAVVVRLNYETHQQLKRTNPDSAATKMLDQIMPNGTGFPNVSVYNPSELSKPIGDVYGTEMSSIQGLITTGQEKMKTAPRTDVRPPGPSTDVKPPAVPPLAKPNDGGAQPKDVIKPSDKAEGVKLEQTEFETKDVAKAFALAREKNLPVVLYKGGDFCPNCPPVKGAVESLASDLASKPTTDAVVVKLKWEDLATLKATDPEAGRLAESFFPRGTRVPQVKVYNPNDTSNPMSLSTGGSLSDTGTLRRMMNEGRDRMKLAPASDRSTTGGTAEAPTGFTERNILAATKAAADKNVPMISYVNDNADPKMASALKYLQDSGLASTVAINSQRADQMFRAGMNPAAFEALKNSIKSAPGTNAAARLNAFTPDSVKQPAQNFSAARSTDAKAGPDQVVDFLKQSGVDLSKGNHEAAVRALLSGAPIPPEPKAEEKKPDAPPEAKKPETPPEVKKPLAFPEPLLLNPDLLKTTPQPEVKKPDAPPQPEVKKPDAPPQPEVKKPDAPPQPEVKVDPNVVPAEAKKPVRPSLKRDLSDILQIKGEKGAEKAANAFKAKDADDALKIIADSKAQGLPLVVHSNTVVCTDNTCTMTPLDGSVPSEFTGKATFLELPRGGFKVPEGAKYDELRAINDLHKVTDEDHKTQVELHVYSYNNKTGAFENNDGPEAGSNSTYIRSRLTTKKP